LARTDKMADQPEDTKNGEKAAAVANTTGKDKEDEMPPTYDEAKGLTSNEPVVKITSNETKIDIGKLKEDGSEFQGLTKEELMKYANDPFWVKLRWFLFVLFWIIWVAMLVASVVIIIYSPKCPSPEPKQWWQKSPLYKMDISELKDDKPSLNEKLDYLVSTGIGTLYLTDVFQSPKRATKSLDISNFERVNSAYGSLDDWKKLLESLKERDQRVVIDFVPNHTSDQHEWFEKSIAQDPEYRDFYVWVEGDASNPPNAWTVQDGKGGSPAWSWNSERGAWYLHTFGEHQPDLNLKNDKVLGEMKKVLQYWIDTGVNGFVLHDVKYLFDDTSLISYEDTLGEQNKNILKDFRSVLDKETEDSGIPCILYADLATSGDKIEKNLYGTITGANVGDLVHLPLSTRPSLTASADSFKNYFYNYMDSLPIDAWPSFTMKSTQLEESLVDAITMFKMLLPGTTLSESGEELGMDNMDWPTANTQQSETESHLQLYSLLANKLRHQEAILFGEVNNRTAFVREETVFGLTRVKKGNPGYLLLINFDDVEKVVDVTGGKISDDMTEEEKKEIEMKKIKHVPASVRMMTRSVQINASIDPSEETKRFDSDAIPMKPKEGKIFTFVPEF